MYYLIDNDPDQRYEQGEEDNVKEECISVDYFESDEDRFDEYLNDTERNVEIYGYEFTPSDVLRSNEGFYENALEDWANDMVSNEYENADYEFRHCCPGDSFWICNYEIFVYEDEEEEKPESAEDITCLKEQVEQQIKKEEDLRSENSRLEDAFMSVFQSIQ